jgi:hypothetical protein
VTVHERLVNAVRHGVAGVPVAATATVRRLGATAQPAGTTTTDARGRFALTVPAGLSRNLRITFPGGAGVLSTSRPLTLAVPARTTLRLSHRANVGAKRVVFRARVNAHGQPIPPGGLTVLVHGRQGRSWATFAAARTDGAGRRRAARRFTGRPGRLPIRALVRRSPAFPFDAGTSRVVAVRER